MEKFLNFIKKSWKILLLVVIIHVSQLLYSTENIAKYSNVILVTSPPEQKKQIIFKTELEGMLEETILVFECYYEDLSQNKYLLQKHVEISKDDLGYKIDGLRDRRPELISK